MVKTIIKFDDLANLCRICLKERENMFSIFEYSKKQMNLNLLKSYNEMLEECTLVHVSKNDVLPKNLCTECSMHLEQSYKLKIQCIMSEKRLRALVENLQIKIETANGNDVENWSFETINDLSIDIIVKAEQKTKIIENENTEVTHQNNLIPLNENKTNLKCPFCNRAFNGLNAFKIHYSKKIRCKICTKKFECRNLAMKHNKFHRTCAICNKVFQSTSACAKHMQSHTKEKKENLEKSNEINLQLELNDENSYSAAKLHTFDSGKTTYWHRASSIDHIDIHTEKMEFTCEVCNKRFKTKAHLFKHSSCHEFTRPFLCNYCGKTFRDNRNFSSHIRIHTNDLRHSCNLCGKKFRTSTSLKFHLTSHSNEKKFTCKICNASYKRQNSLKSHMDNHTDEQFACEICGKFFATKTSRMRHRKIHTGVRKHICSYCNKPFLKTDALKMHLRIHTGEKPFECTICGRKFAQKHVLNNHLKTHDKS